MSDTLSTPTLPTFSWIGHLKEDDRELLSSYGEFFPGHPGSIIIEEGVLQTEVFVVISGELEVHKGKEDGERQLLARVGPGETIGEISLFDPGAATATVTAVEFSQLWRIADSDLIQFMQDNPGAGNVLLRTLATILAQRLRRTDPEAFSLSTFAVVESPELDEQDSVSAAESALSEASAEAATTVTPPAVQPLRPAASPVTAPTGARSVAPALSAESEASARGEKKSPKKTQPIVEADELEPL